MGQLSRAKRAATRRLTGRNYRTLVRGRWDRMGELQLEFLRSRGLEPGHLLLDVGCGPLRGGSYFVDYLEPGRYYGIDIRESVLDGGYEKELPERLREKLPRDHLRATDRFEADFGVEFDFAIAQSLFTHVSLNHIRLCLVRVAEVMKQGGRFYATFVEAPPDFPVDGVMHENEPGRRSRYNERNPFWYWRSDLEWAASFGPWRFEYVGDWNHPRGQMMVELVRL